MQFEIHPSLYTNRCCSFFLLHCRYGEGEGVDLEKKTERKEEAHQSEMYSAIKVIRDKGGKRVLEVYDDERSSRGS